MYGYISETDQAVSTANGTWAKTDDTHLQLNWTSGTGIFSPKSTTYTILTFTNSALVLEYVETSSYNGQKTTTTVYFTR